MGLTRHSHHWCRHCPSFGVGRQARCGRQGASSSRPRCSLVCCLYIGFCGSILWTNFEGKYNDAVASQRANGSPFYCHCLFYYLFKGFGSCCRARYAWWFLFHGLDCGRCSSSWRLDCCCRGQIRGQCPQGLCDVLLDYHFLYYIRHLVRLSCHLPFYFGSWIRRICNRHVFRTRRRPSSDATQKQKNYAPAQHEHQSVSTTIIPQNSTSHVIADASLLK